MVEIKNHFKEITDKIYDYAHQKGKVSHSKQGRDYQKYIVALMNLSLFRTKLLGAQNQPDGISYLFPNGKKVVIDPPYNIKKE